MPDAVEIKVAAIVRAAECRIGEIHVAVFANHNVVRRVEFLSLIVLGERLDLALQIQSRHPASFRFADVQTPLQVIGKAGCAAVVVSQYLRMRIGIEPEDLALADIGDGQKSGARPRESVHELQIGCNSFQIRSSDDRC